MLLLISVTEEACQLTFHKSVDILTVGVPVNGLVVFWVLRSPLTLDIVLNVSALRELNPRLELGQIYEAILVCVYFIDNYTAGKKRVIRNVHYEIQDDADSHYFI